MEWFFSVVLVLCLSSTTKSQIVPQVSTSDDYDCEVPPPLGVEPLTCCQVSKPFDRINFPECFAVSAPPPTTSTLPPIPVSEDFEDFSTTPRNRKVFPPSRSTAIPNKGTTNTNLDENDNRNDDRNGNRNGDDDRSDDGGNDKHHGFGHWPGKYHWGYDNHRHGFHGDYHHHSRHRRQAIYRTNATPSNLCAIECIFNQTNILTNGRFDRDIALDVYADYYPEVPIDLLTRTIDRCTKQLQNYLIARRRRNRNQINQNVLAKLCRNGSGLFAACFNREIYRNCPTELDTDSDDCSTLRTFIDNCSPIRAAKLNFSYDSVDVDRNGNFIPQDS